jgi:hypothetical protein
MKNWLLLIIIILLLLLWGNLAKPFFYFWVISQPKIKKRHHYDLVVPSHLNRGFFVSCLRPLAFNILYNTHQTLLIGG